MKKLTFLLVAMAAGLLAACTSDVLEGTLPDDAVRQTPGDAVALLPEAGMQSEAYRSYETLMGLMKAQTRSAGTSAVYPEYYGGSYVDDNGKLVVLLASSEAATRSAGSLKGSLSDGSVVYKTCTYSYNTLNALVARITEKAESGASFIYDNVGMFGVDDETNSVLVGLYDNSMDAIAQFRNNVADSPALRFAQCSPILNHALNCADSIGATFSRASVGYRAKDKSGNPGIVTAGHFIVVNQQLCEPIGFNVIGVCTQSRLDDGLIDAAFCKVVATNYMPTNRIAYMANPAADTLSVDLAQPPANLYVNMVGMRSKRQSGKVYIASMNVVDSSQKRILTDVIIAEYATQHGDSGGIVYALTSSINKRSTVGINKGSTVINGKTYGVCIKAYLINQTFGLSRY